MLGIYALLITLMWPQAISPLEKASRTPAEKKISSQLLYEIYRVKDQTNPKRVLPENNTIVRIDPKQRALVDVRTAVTQTFTRQLVRLGGTIVSTSPEAHSVIAWVPLLSLERLAESPSVLTIQIASAAIHNNKQ